MLLIERYAPVVRLSCLKQCEKQDAAKIFYSKFPEHECRAYFMSKITMRAWPVARSIFDAPLVREANKRTTNWIMSKKANFGQKWRLSSH